MDEVALVELIATHGIEGEIKGRPFSGESAHLVGLTDGEVRLRDRRIPVEVESVRPVHRGILIKFRNYGSIEHARRLVGGELWAAQRWAAPLGDGEFYISDLIGSRILYEKEEIGVVTAVFDGPQAALLEIEHRGGRALLPFLNVYVDAVDLRTRVLTIKERWIIDSV